MKHAAISAVVISLILLIVIDAHAQGDTVWFAMGVGPDGVAGWSKPRPTKADAEEEAFRNCASASQKPRECKVVFVPRGGCVVVVHCNASGKQTAWTGVSEQLKDALDEAFQQPIAVGIAENSCKKTLHWCPK
jgi:Domain of unknown function (DUF4189)